LITKSPLCHRRKPRQPGLQNNGYTNNVPAGDIHGTKAHQVTIKVVANQDLLVDTEDALKKQPRGVSTSAKIPPGQIIYEAQDQTSHLRHPEGALTNLHPR